MVFRTLGGSSVKATLSLVSSYHLDFLCMLPWLPPNISREQWKRHTVGFEDQENVYFLLELASGGELKNHLSAGFASAYCIVALSLDCVIKANAIAIVFQGTLQDYGPQEG